MSIQVRKKQPKLELFFKAELWVYLKSQLTVPSLTL